MRRSRAARLGAVGFVGGMAVGLLLWSSQMRRSRRELFSSKPLRRVAALGYISAHPSVDNARALRDYIRWESHPLLRRRGESALRQMQDTLVA